MKKGSREATRVLHVQAAVLFGLLAALTLAPGATADAASPAPPGPIARRIEEAKAAGGSFRTVELFAPRMRAKAADDDVRAALKDGLVLAVDPHALGDLLAGEASEILLAVPAPLGGTVQLELTPVELLAPGFRVRTASGTGTVAIPKARHFWGVVAGVPGSLAAVSVFGDEVMGIYRLPGQGPVVLGRLGGENPAGDHVIYREEDLMAASPLACHTGAVGDLVPASFEASQTFAPEAKAGAAVRIYFEADYDIFLQRSGSAAAVVNFVTGLFAQSAILYQNEGIPMALSEIFVWDRQSPYGSPRTSGAKLAAFQVNRRSFNGDLGHLLAVHGDGGIAASFAGLCNSDRRQSQCVSQVQQSFLNVPQYSYSVFIITHEMGHLLGSPHTHACVWNGDDTAIDSCAGFTETITSPYQQNVCPLPRNPSRDVGGTIMSYCDQLPSVGVRFENGFGPQPGDLIRSRVAAARCLGASNALAIRRHPANRSARPGAAADFSVTAAGGTPPYLYQWQFSTRAAGPFANLANGGAVSGATTASLGINPAAGRAGYYRCRVTDSSSGPAQIFSNAAALTVLPEDQSAVTVTATDPDAAETAGNPGGFTLARTGSTAAALTVTLGRSGSATNGEDYAPVATTWTFAAGQRTLPIAVLPIDDAAIEDAESVTLTVAAGAGYIVGTPASATVLLANDDFTPCTPDATRLCLQHGRFAATLTAVANGSTHTGHAIPITDTSGGFWLFSPDNAEVGVKILDGTAVNGKMWVYHGGATDVAYTLTVIDQANPGRPGTFTKAAGSFCGGADVGFFVKSAAAPPASSPAPSSSQVKAFTCTPNATTACLQGNRFEVRVKLAEAYRPILQTTSDAAFFWFYSADNLESFVKVLDGTPVNGKHWALFGSLTDQPYALEITDSVTGRVKIYHPGAFCGGADVDAF